MVRIDDCSFLSLDTESINFDHHLRCGGWLNFEFSKREDHSGWAIKPIYKKHFSDLTVLTIIVKRCKRKNKYLSYFLWT